MSDLFAFHIMRHLDSAFSVAHWYLGNRADAEDAVQDSVLSAYKAFAEYRGENGRAWLLQIVRNRCLRMLESRGKVVSLHDEEVEQVPSNQNLEASVLAQIRSSVLREEVSSLPETLREVIVLRELEGLSYAEIASVTAIPIGTVMSRLSRARAQLLAKLKLRAEEVGA
jgi:RNA polymerase sigma-70 factor (ECF subfamily)